jgi:methionyl-tRNA synthetase
MIDIARTGNQYLSEREPWHLIKTDREKTATTLHLASQLVRSIGIMLAPFLPETSERIQSQLNIKEKQNWWDAGKMDLKTGHIINKSEPLFHKILVNKT